MLEKREERLTRVLSSKKDYMKDTNVIKDIKKDFEDSFKESHKVEEKESKTGLFKGLWQAILRLFAPMM